MAAALIAALSWATPGLFIRALADFAPMTIVTGRCAVALAAALLLVAAARNGGLKHALRRPLPWVLASLMGAYYALSVAAFTRAPIADVALLIALSPPFALVWRLCIGEHIRPAEWLGSALAIAGVVVIVWPSGAPLSGFERRWQGDLLALGGAAAMAVYAIAYAAASARASAPDARATTALSFALASAVFALYSAVAGDGPSPGELARPTVLGAFAGLGIIATITPSLFYSIASKRLSATTASASRLLTPVLAALLAALVIGELPAPNFWPGSALVLAGLWILLRRG